MGVKHGNKELRRGMENTDGNNVRKRKGRPRYRVMELPMQERKEDEGDGSLEEGMASQEDGRVEGRTLEDNNGKESENMEEKEDFKNENEDLWYGEQNEDELMESYSVQQHRRD